MFKVREQECATPITTHLRLIGAVALLVAAPLRAQEPKPIDPRLAAIRKVLIVAGDPLGADYAVARCLSERLPQQLPLTVVTAPTDADAQLRITARLVDDGGPPQTSPGPKNHVTITAVLPDTTTAWTETYFSAARAIPRTRAGSPTRSSRSCARP